MPVKHPIKVNYSERDIGGDNLQNITGARIYVRHPGTRVYVIDGFLPYGENEDIYWVELVSDGAFATSVTIVTDCRESEMSDPEELIVNILPPARPVPGLVTVPCPQDQGRGALIEYGVTYPKNDIQGNHLLKISGCEIEVIMPGARPGDSGNPIQFLAWPFQDSILNVDQDGSFRIRYRVVGACARSEWSDATPVSINMQPAAKPPAPVAMETCTLAPKPST